MNYLIRMMNKSEVMITEQEYRNLNGKSGLVHIPSQDRIINTNSIVEIVKEEDVRREKKNNLTGVLHDGTPVVRQFGQWYLHSGDRDESGKYLNVIDPTYYKEVARDCVPAPEEYYQKYAHLPVEERLKLIVGDRKELTGGGFESLENISEKYRLKSLDSGA